MRIINNELHISAPIDTVFSWFKNLDKNYLKWHPPTHQEFVWQSDKPIGKGTKFCFKEEIEGHKHKFFMVITDYIENERLSFASEFIQVESKIFPDKIMGFLSSFFRIKMEMEREFKAVSDNKTVIYTKHRLGCLLPIINRLVESVISAFIFSSRYHKNHMKEEDEYMKLNLEA